MKKLNLWLFASLFVAAFTLSACGDDDTSGDNPGNPTSIEGKWHAYVKAWGDGLCSRYNHDITYEFKSDKTFMVEACWEGGGENIWYRFSGTYSDANNIITLNVKKAEGKYNGSNSYVVDDDFFFMWDVYTPDTNTWSFDWGTKIDPSSVALPYSISGTKLQLGKPNRNLVYNNHGLLTASFDWQGK